MKKALFIDRDGTLIVEPPVDRQVDSLEKLRFVPGAISGLRALSGLDFELVLATNQDGLGTPSFPEATFRPAHERMLATLEGEGVRFDDQLIDRTFEADDAPTRKPRTGMFGRYLDGSYDLAASYVVGDRPTDMLLARNLGARGILLAPDEEAGRRALREAGAEAACALVAPSWERIAEFIRRGERSVTLTRRTAETQITLTLDLDGRSGAGRIASGIGFFDHMLAQIAHHGGVALSVEATGDLWVDEHHTVEDVGIVLGEASSAMARLREKGLDTLVPALTCPVLGICIGMQLLCRSSEEGDAACLGIFPTDVVRLPDRTADGPLKVPHMGWDTVDMLRGPLFEGIDAQTYVYYVHSYAPRLCDAAIATTDYGMRFSAALARDNFFGTQFHPEKSGAAGSRILRNFLTLK